MYKKIRILRVKGRFVSYFKKCPYCLYSGNGWNDAGECPCCGETS